LPQEKGKRTTQKTEKLCGLSIRRLNIEFVTTILNFYNTTLLYIFAIYMKEIFNNCEGFEWDKGNFEKNWIHHKVMQGECEQVFFNEPIIVFFDEKHSQIENRWYLLGRTDAERLLFIVFTIRRNTIRVISAGDMNKKERKNYYEQT